MLIPREQNSIKDHSFTQGRVEQIDGLMDVYSQGLGDDMVWAKVIAMVVALTQP